MLRACSKTTIEQLKITNHAQLASLRKEHTLAIEKKNIQLKESSKMLSEMHELHLELATEIVETECKARRSGNEVMQLKACHKTLKNRMSTQRHEVNSLADDVRMDKITSKHWSQRYLITRMP